MFKRNHAYPFFNYTTYLFGITVDCIYNYLGLARYNIYYWLSIIYI